MQNIKDNKKSLKIKAKQGKLSLKVVNYIKNQWKQYEGFKNNDE